MQNYLRKYELSQDGKRYLLTSNIQNNFIRITCSEIDNKFSPAYIGDFTLDSLRQINSSFNSMLTLKDAQDLLNKTIEEEKVSIEKKGNNFIVSLFFLNENQNVGLPLKEYNSVQITYSPPKYLPIKIIHYPPVEIRRPTIYYNEEKKDNNIYPAKASKIDKLSLTLTPFRNNDILAQSSYTNPPVKKSNTYIIQKSMTPQNQANEYIIGSPKRQQTKFTNSVNPYNYHPIFQPNQPIVKKSIVINPNNSDKCKQNFFELETEFNRIRPEHEQLKAETYRLADQVKQLKGQIDLLNQENSDIKKSRGFSPNDNEIALLKKQLERSEEENSNLKNKKDSEFEQIKKIKDDEINLYKSQVDDLIKSRQNMINENNDLKVQMQEIIKNKDIIQSQYEELLSSRENSLKENLNIIKGEIFQNNNEIEFISARIVGDYSKINLTLLYKATIDSDRAEAFHEKCDNEKSSLILIKTTDGKRFGGYTSCDWKGNSIDKKDDNAFIFSLDKMEIYDIIPGEDAIGCYPRYGPVFLGCQIRIYDEAFTKGGTTFKKGVNYNTREDYELTGGLRKFNVEEIEVYGVELE